MFNSAQVPVGHWMSSMIEGVVLEMGNGADGECLRGMVHVDVEYVCVPFLKRLRQCVSNISVDQVLIYPSGDFECSMV